MRFDKSVLTHCVATLWRAGSLTVHFSCGRNREVPVSLEMIGCPIILAGSADRANSRPPISGQTVRLWVSCIEPTERRSNIWRYPNAPEIHIVAACVGRHSNPLLVRGRDGARWTDHRYEFRRSGTAHPRYRGIVSGSAGSAGGVLNSVAPLLGSADAPGTVPGFPSVPLPAAPPADDRVVGGWYGTWTVPDGTYPAVLNISQANPPRANIDIPGRPCNADWTGKPKRGISRRASYRAIG